jgi:4-amino-4-deoxy-L-arabinose transferase-like glycosyltransferase
MMAHSPSNITQSQKEIGIMHDRSTIDLIHQTTRTRRVAIALILLALALPSLFAWNDNVALESAGEFTGQLAAVTLLALIARLWVARHYSPGVQVQVLLAFALVLISWSGYVSRTAHNERVAAVAQTVSSTPSRIPGQVEPVDSKLEGAQR